MYVPTALNNNARLNPLSENARKLSRFIKNNSILRSNSRQMTKIEERNQRELFMSKLHESNQTIGLQVFQGLNGGHILHRKR